jgi:predicted Zn finger-like uncharacterized protein
MKIVCDACQAKYSISDDKVQGKVFKIRCKKCSNIIVVRGGGGGAGAAEPTAAPAAEKDTRVYDYGYEGGAAPAGDESVWHVVINQDQVGPMTAAEVQQRFSSGEIDAETYAWREGFADWQPLAQVDAFAEFVQSAGAGSEASGGRGGGNAVSSMFGTTGMGDEAGTSRNDPGDLFAAASAGSRRGEEDDGGDLFGSKPGTGSRQPVAGGAMDAAAAARLRGERNENSVLFSLNNLAQLASDKPASITAPPSSMGHATGVAGGEGSGLIDIRSMANAYLGGAGAAAKPAASSAIGSMDDLPVFGGGGFSEPAVLVPTGRPAANNKMMFVLIGAVGFLAVAAVILVVVLIGGKDKNDKPAAVAAADTADKDSDKGSDDKDADKGGETKPETTPAGDPPKTAETVTPKAPDTAEDPKATDTRPKSTATAGSRPTKSTAVASRTEPKKTTTATTPTEPKPAADAGGGCDEVSCVLNNYEGACCQKFRKGGSRPSSSGGAPKASGDLPDRLDRAMISEGVSKVKARVMACGDKSSAKGQVKVSVKVSGDGRIANVSVASSPDPGLGNCVASAMRGATFRKTQNGGSFGYPFVF